MLITTSLSFPLLLSCSSSAVPAPRSASSTCPLHPPCCSHPRVPILLEMSPGAATCRTGPPQLPKQSPCSLKHEVCSL